MLHTFQYKNITIAYNKTGSGQPVILIHGFGEDSSIWYKQEAALQPHCLLLVPDLPGSGQSMVLIETDNKPVSIEDYAACIYALVQHEKLEAVILAGHSMGGYIALAYAQKYQSTLKGLGLLHSTAFADSAEKKAARIKGIATIAQTGGYLFLKNSIPTLFAEVFKSQHAHEVDQLVEQGKAFNDQALMQYYQAMMERPDRTHVLQSTQIPVLFFIGDKDVAAPLTDLMQQVHLPSISYIHILKNVGHMGMWEAMREFNELLITFITDITNQ